MTTRINFLLLTFLFLLASGANAQDRNENLKKTKKAFMGVTMGTSWGDGVEISEISKNYGAERAGLKAGDIITSINNDKINNKEDFTKIVGMHNPGEKVEVRYLRGKEKMTAKVKLAESPYGFSISASDWNWNWDGNVDNLKIKMKRKEKAVLGIYPATDWSERAVKIDGFTENSAAREAGLKKGDFILKIGTVETNTEDELRYALEKYKPFDEAEISYKSSGEIYTKKIKLGQEKVIDWDNFNISVSDEQSNSSSPIDKNKEEDNRASRSWSSYTFADGTEVSINNFTVNPNPIINTAEISFESKLAKPFDVVIYNSEGKEMTRKAESSMEGKFRHVFNFDSYSKGDYFVKIWMDGKEVFSQKISKQ
ncbi:MAG: PDZ domain-containing protein [Saprospiraceae bacterium]